MTNTRTAADAEIAQADERPGEVTEWPKVYDWKSYVSKGTEGSNPSLSSMWPHAGPGMPLKKWRFVFARCFASGI